MIRLAALVAVLLPLTMAGVTRPEVGTVRVASALPGWGWPLGGAPTVVRAFDPPAAPWSPGHRGVDLTGTPGDPVLAAGAGVVAFAGTVAGRGVVSVDHAGGLRTTYEPVSASVRIGDPVGLGTPLGVLDAGHRGCAAPACLHWGLRRGATYLNPLLVLRPLRVRLKPLTLGLAVAPPTTGSRGPWQPLTSRRVGAGPGALPGAGPACLCSLLRGLTWAERSRPKSTVDTKPRVVHRVRPWVIHRFLS